MRSTGQGGCACSTLILIPEHLCVIAAWYVILLDMPFAFIGSVCGTVPSRCGMALPGGS